MAANSFNATHRAEPVRGGRLKTVLTVLRETADAIVSSRMRLAASEAEHVRPRQPRGRSAPLKNAK
jgi:hypothetical protein